MDDPNLKGNGQGANPPDPAKQNKPDKAKRARLRKRVIKYLLTTLIGLVVFVTALFVTAAVFIVVNGRKTVNQQAAALPRDITQVVPDEVQAATNDNSVSPSNSPAPTVTITQEPKAAGGFLQNIIQAPRKTNALIMGTDQSGGLTDYIVFVSFDSVTKNIDVISIPRDTYITITPEQVRAIRDNGSHFVPDSGVMKLTELHSYAGSLGDEYSKNEVEQLLGVNIDYVANVNLKAFRNIIDLVGGIYVNVPSGGMYYSDPVQNLTISIPGGRQLLGGSDAEGFMRYRHDLTRGDLDRIDNQKEFMKEFFTQVVQKDILANNFIGLMQIFLDNVKTNFNLTDVPQYLTSLSGITTDNVSFYTMPGDASYQGAVWYYIQDVAGTDKLIAQTALNFDVNPAPVNIGAVRVQFFNGSYSTKAAPDMVARLEENGYDVTDAGDYVGAKKTSTRVYARDEATGDALAQLFVKATVDTSGDNIPGGYDAVVVAGTGEAAE